MNDRSALLCAILCSTLSAPASAQPQALAQNAQNPGDPRTGAVTPFDPALRVEALDGVDGWQVALPGGRPLATAAVVDGVVYVGGGYASREVYALDAMTGETRWAIRVSDDGPTAAVVAEGFVAFNTESCTLFVVDAETGEPVWSRWLGDPLMSQPAIAAGRVYMAYPAAGASRLAAFDLRTGAPLWERPIPAEVISAPVVSGDSVYAATFDGHVHRFRAEDGELVFSRQEQVTSAPWVVNERVYVSLHDETEAEAGRAVEAQSYLVGHTGARSQARGTSWSRREAFWLDERVQSASAYRIGNASSDSNVGWGGGAPPTANSHLAQRNVGRNTVRGMWEFQGSRPLVVGGVSFATVGDAVEAIDAETGEPRWAHSLSGDVEQLGGHLGAPPALAGGRLIIGTTDGRVLGLSADDGEERFHYDVGGSIRSQVAVANGRIYASTTDGRLVMIDTDDPTVDGWPMWGGGPTHLLDDDGATSLRAPAAPAADASLTPTVPRLAWVLIGGGLGLFGLIGGAWLRSRRRSRS